MNSWVDFYSGLLGKRFWRIFSSRPKIRGESAADPLQTIEILSTKKVHEKTKKSPRRTDSDSFGGLADFFCSVIVADPQEICCEFKGLQWTLADSAVDLLESAGKLHLADSPEVHADQFGSTADLRPTTVRSFYSRKSQHHSKHWRGRVLSQT